MRFPHQFSKLCYKTVRASFCLAYKFDNISKYLENSFYFHSCCCKSAFGALRLVANCRFFVPRRELKEVIEPVRGCQHKHAFCQHEYPYVWIRRNVNRWFFHRSILQALLQVIWKLILAFSPHLIKISHTLTPDKNRGIKKQYFHEWL